MAIMAKSSGDFVNCPPGAHSAVCCDVVDLGMQTTEYMGQKKEQHKVRICWQIGEDMENGKPFIVQRKYTLSLGEKASLKRDLESWRGKPFNQEQLLGFDVETLLNVPCFLNVVHQHVGDKTYANVASIMPLPKGMSRLIVRDYVRVRDREPEQQDNTPSEVITDEDIPF